MNTGQRRGWCPGALRPMETGDGLLVRLRITGGVVSLHKAHGIAALARLYGNGHIDLSSRANLQIRGVKQAALPALWEGLDALGLLDSSPETEAVRNVIASPLSDCDPAAAFDAQPLAHSLEARLVADPRLQALPSKFGFLIDAGGAFSLEGISADIRFQALGENRLAIGLDQQDGPCWIGGCTVDELAPLAVETALAFLEYGQGAPSRMRYQTRAVIETIAQRLVSHLQPVRVLPLGRSDPFPIGLLTIDSQSLAHGLALPFGRMTGDMLEELANLAHDHGVHSMRLTPWRVLLLPFQETQPSSEFLAHADSIGFITDAQDPRLMIVACSGAPSCSHATVATIADANAIAATMPPEMPVKRITVHVSGCVKSCARREAADITLVGDQGGYQAVFQGRAGDSPSQFLTAQQAIDLCAREHNKGFVSL